ncbi:MAG: AtpZ/AtpI family protein [Chloroflexi bacterium]|nr:AtpZ/AtpI family protein [Chloroflexota bacterium]
MLNSPAFSLVGIGFSLAFWIVGGALLGDWLDNKYDTTPALTLVLLVLGMLIGFYDAYRRLRDVMKRTKRKAG